MNNADSTDAEFDLHGAIQQHLPYLRRFARALTGSQERGDANAATTLEAIIADRSAFDASLPANVALFRVFHSVWAGTEVSGNDDSTESIGVEATAQRRLSALTPPSREAFLLGALEGFSPTEISAIMDIQDSETDMLQKAAVTEIENQTAARILVIEDEPIIAMDIESIVMEMGHESVGIADTHDAAMKLATDERPDLILSDIQLADGSSGIDAAHDILAQFDVPIIFITAYPERLLTGERPEPTFMISKPFKRSAVQAAVSQALFFGSAAAIKV